MSARICRLDAKPTICLLSHVHAEIGLARRNEHRQREDHPFHLTCLLRINSDRQCPLRARPTPIAEFSGVRSATTSGRSRVHTGSGLNSPKTVTGGVGLAP